MVTKIGAARLTAAAVAAAGLLLGPAAQASTPRLTGTQLTSALLPRSYLPAGYKLESNSAYSTGRRLVHSAPRHNLTKMTCKDFLLNGVPGEGFGETAAAGNAYDNRRQGYAQSVYQFATPAKALTFYRQLFALYSHCRSLTDTSGGMVTKVWTRSFGPTHDGRYRAFRAVQFISLSGFPTNINDQLFAVSGTDVYGINAFGITEPTRPAITAALLHMIARVKAVR